MIGMAYFVLALFLETTNKDVELEGIWMAGMACIRKN